MSLNTKIAEKKRSLLEKTKRAGKLFYYKVLRIQATPASIARGFAVGVFIGFLPLLPVQTICAVTLAFIVRGSKIAAALGTWVSNPINWVPLYLAFYHIGHALLPFDIPRLNLKEIEFLDLLHRGPRLLIAMMLGGFVIALPSSIITYFISKRFITLYQKKRAERKKKKKEAQNK